MVCGFTPGAWVEVTDDFHEFGGVPGEMHQILVVDDVKLTITLTTPLNAAQFNISNPTQRNTRVILWGQSGVVRDMNNNIIVDVDQNGGLIPIAQNTTVVLEDGIQATFSLDPAIATNPQFHLGDYWIFTARVVDASIDVLTKAPPRGVHHHYCRLAVVSFPGTPADCRTFWPPDFRGDCECAACVKAEDHNSGKFTIQNAIDQSQGAGGKVCLGPGIYQLEGADQDRRRPGTAARRPRADRPGCAPGSPKAPMPAILIDGSSFVTLASFGLVLAPGFRFTHSPTGQTITVSTPGIMIQNSASVTVERCQFYSFGNLPRKIPPSRSAASSCRRACVRIPLDSGCRMQRKTWSSVPAPGSGICRPSPTSRIRSCSPSTFTCRTYFMQCGSSGINLDALSYHAWQVGISGNFIGPVRGGRDCGRGHRRAGALLAHRDHRQ